MFLLTLLLSLLPQPTNVKHCLGCGSRSTCYLCKVLLVARTDGVIKCGRSVRTGGIASASLPTSVRWLH